MAEGRRWDGLTDDLGGLRVLLGVGEVIEDLAVASGHGVKARYGRQGCHVSSGTKANVEESRVGSWRAAWRSGLAARLGGR